MFAHQVVEDLKFLKKEQGKYNINFNVIIENIQSAQKFHLNTVSDLREFPQKNKAKMLFSEGKEMRLPYYCSWFDWQWIDHSGTVPHKVSSKRAALAIQPNPDLNEFILFMFAFLDVYRLWAPGPIRYLVKPGTGCGGVPTTNFPINVDVGIEEDKNDLAVFANALMLLGCTNIGTEKHAPPVALNKKRQKAGKQPLLTYHTLVLKPVGRHQESIPRHLWNNCIHLMRGHFKTYTDEKPLFGRITGRFWWQPAVRGKNKDGVVMKDYEVRI